jgi:hypothetical protein
VGIGQRVIAGGKVFEIKNITELPSRHPLLKLEFNYSDAAENAPRAAKVQRFSALP